MNEAFITAVWFEEKKLKILSNPSFYFVYYKFNIRAKLLGMKNPHSFITIS